MIDIKELKALAEAATPQDFDSAEVKIQNGYIECPHCGGQGEVEMEADYCNYDNAAIGVQFYGIGNEFGSAEAYYRAANPAAVLELIAEVERLRREEKNDKIAYDAVLQRQKEIRAERDQLKADLKQSQDDTVIWKGGVSALGEALKKLTFCARTTGGTAGPDQALMDACESAENALSLVGVSRAIDYIEGLKAENEALRQQLNDVLDCSTELRKDAERYQWLRGNDYWDNHGIISGRDEVSNQSGCNLDCAVDEAMSKVVRHD